MTIIGAHVLGPALAVCWADTHVFCAKDCTPAHHAVKLSLNPLASMAGVGAGWSAVAFPGAVGVLSLAVVRPDGVSAGPLHDFGTGEVLPGPPQRPRSRARPDETLSRLLSRLVSRAETAAVRRFGLDVPPPSRALSRIVSALSHCPGPRAWDSGTARGWISHHGHPEAPSPPVP